MEATEGMIASFSLQITSMVSSIPKLTRTPAKAFSNPKRPGADSVGDAMSNLVKSTGRVLGA